METGRDRQAEHLHARLLRPPPGLTHPEAQAKTGCGFRTVLLEFWAFRAWDSGFSFASGLRFRV